MSFFRVGSLFVSLILLSSCLSVTSFQSKHIPAAEPHSEKQNLIMGASCPDAIGDSALVGKASLNVTHGQVIVSGGKTLKYTATAGYLPIYSTGKTSGDVRACLFYFAYTRDDHAGDKTWPVTFLFNGGPGSPSDWLHLGGLGPHKMDFGPEGLDAKSSNLIDNVDTLLAHTDLVFVDPINSGFSRPAKGVDPSEFNGLNQDADSIGDFVRAYLTEASRMYSPKYIVGESYGGMRIPVLGRYLDEKLGIKLAGVVFVSPWWDALVDEVFGERDAADDLPFVVNLPEFATTAWYHHKLASDLQALTLEEVFAAAQDFAEHDYLEALAAGDGLAQDARVRIASQVARFSGLSEEFIDSKGLRPTLDQFRSELLKSTGEVMSYYDGRLKSAVSNPISQDPYDAFNPLFDAADKAYFNGTLGVDTDLEYTENDWKSWPGANPSGGIQGGYISVLDDINALVTNNASLKIYVASGLFDLTVPAEEVHFLIHHLKPAVAARFSVSHYVGGHPVYFGRESSARFSAEMAKFYAN